MKYYLIAGEASGDLHASNLMRAIKNTDPQADFRFLGGDLMKQVGGTLVKHYREMAFMGFIPVLMNLRTILRNMQVCWEDIRQYQPDVVILIDYPGFNLKIAKYVKTVLHIPVHYYISPKIFVISFSPRTFFASGIPNLNATTAKIPATIPTSIPTITSVG